MTTTRRLWPREYGAYAELVFPLLTALVAGRPTLSAVAFSVAALIWFLLHEPLVILRGARGERLRIALAGRARARIRLLVVMGTVAAVFAVVWAPAAARVAALAPAACAGVLIPSVVRGREKTLPAEVIMAGALSSMMLPVGLAAGIATEWVVIAAAVWFLSFVVATLLVHAVKAWHHKSARPVTKLGAPVAAVVVVAAALVVAGVGVVPVAAGLAVVPTALVALGASALRVHPRQLRSVGWSVVGANVVSLGLLLAA